MKATGTVASSIMVESHNREREREREKDLLLIWQHISTQIGRSNVLPLHNGPLLFLFSKKHLYIWPRCPQAKIPTLFLIQCFFFALNN